MNDEQTVIINFLKCSPGAWFAKKEIARRGVKRKEFEDNPRWSEEPLRELIAQQLVEQNNDGQVRLKQ
jgi:hypothetical protein